MPRPFLQSWILRAGEAGSRTWSGIQLKFWNYWPALKSTERSLFWAGLQQYPGLVRKIAAAGHELASHSYWHRQIFRLQPQEFREDTQRAKDIVEQITGQPIYGYRAPTFSIVESSLWALEILAELGFHYDSSIFPIRHDRYGIPQAPRFPFRINTPAEASWNTRSLLSASGVNGTCRWGEAAICGYFPNGTLVSACGGPSGSSCR